MSMLSLLAVLLLPRSEESDLVDWIVKIGAFLFFIGVPLIRGIVQARQKANEAAQKGDAGSARDRAAEGRRAFEELMRGGTTLAPPEIPPVVPAPSSSRPRDVETAVGSPARTAGSKPLTEREELSSTPLSGSELDAEEGAPEAELDARVERREREELQRQRDEARVPETIAREEYAASSSSRESVEPVPVEVFRIPAMDLASAPPSSEVQRRLLAPGGAGDRRTQLRRALIWSEVVGRPVGLRGDADASLPVGLR
jgi:hypothetical protein